MKPAVRFGLALLAFVAWLSYLLFLVSTARDPVVLARPQFLVSTLDVVAEVDAPDAKTVRIEEVHWPQADRERLHEKQVTVTNLADCEGWNGPGQYILPLSPQGKEYRVAPLPRSPGFPAYSQRPRIYPATPSTLRQLAEIHKALR